MGKLKVLGLKTTDCESIWSMKNEIIRSYKVKETFPRLVSGLDWIVLILLPEC